jgi:hypothetical protein
MDDQLPDHWFAFLLHFTLHGIHHYLPMDKWVAQRPCRIFHASDTNDMLFWDLFF